MKVLKSNDHIHTYLEFKFLLQRVKFDYGTKIHKMLCIAMRSRALIWKIGTTALLNSIISTLYKEFEIDWLKIDNRSSSFATIGVRAEAVGPPN